MANDKAKVVMLDGKKFVAHMDKEGKPQIIAFGGSFDTGIPCPPTQGNECPHGYDEECINGTIWCMGMG